MSMSPVSGLKEAGLRNTGLLNKTSPPFSSMGEIKNFTVQSLDLDSFLSVKVKIRHDGLLDSSLKTNLEYAMQTLDAFPAPKRYDASLTVEGERQLVRITAGTPVLLYSVRLGPKGPELYQKVLVGARLTPSCLNDGHFAGHQCQDELESCMDQAKCILNHEVQNNPTGLSDVELRISCGELRLTYLTHQPQRSLVVQPRRRAYLGKTLNLEKVLELKTRLERSGVMGKGLLACFQHLLLHYTTFQEENCRLVLQSDGEMLELVYGRPDYHSTQHYIFTDSQNQAYSHRVQDIDLWEYD
ncbi:uncharacterized protein LOC103021512 [Astyanax mexicanus]|uniref:uncharacterized protein LOC103021512 n=1 Tax=Astyanax mexicanus TaxID=7994 RepID=UPI0020CAD194|nr:uncharacterized protein LOC103021512 [Astyanax mexicanus]